MATPDSGTHSRASDIPAESEAIRRAIEARFGFFPPFFEPALPNPQVLKNLWDQTLSAYIENPLPDLFKEKLAALLARYCHVPYCLICHTSALRPLGMKAADVLELLSLEAMSLEEIEEHVKWLDKNPLQGWPEPASMAEECVISCCISIFLNENTPACHEKLRGILTADQYGHLVSFLSYNRTCLSWAEAYPELTAEADERARCHLGPLLEEEPELSEFFREYHQRSRQQGSRRSLWLTREVRRLSEKQEDVAYRLRSAHERLSRIGQELALGQLSAEILPGTLDFGAVDADFALRKQFGLPETATVTVDEVLERIKPEDRKVAREAIRDAVRTGEVARKTVHVDAGSVRIFGWANYDRRGKPLSFELFTAENPRS